MQPQIHCIFDMYFLLCFFSSVRLVLIAIRPHSPGYVREDFDVTPKMSTYLVAFMITDLVKSNPTRIAATNPDLPNISIWSRKEATDMTQ